MTTIAAREVHVAPLSIERMQRLIDPEGWNRLMVGLGKAHELLDDRQLWNVNSTAAGGGVAEMLRSWVGLARGLGIGMRWLTIAGDADFFEITKRLHNQLHGSPGDGGSLGDRERGVYERVGRDNVASVLDAIGPGDVVFLHDPQTAMLIPDVVAAGRTVVWRCHVGTDESNPYSEAAWGFLEPYVTEADAAVFSREAFVPGYCQGMTTMIVPPSIDALSPKNQEIERDAMEAILCRAGLIECEARVEPAYELPDGTVRRVERRCEVVGAGPLPDTECAIVTQVSRWDRLKDPIGVMRGFALALAAGADAHLVLAGPSLGSVADDPEGLEVFAEVEVAWRALPEDVRARDSPRLPADGRPRRKRGDGQRPAAARHGGRPEEPQGGLRPDGDGGDVEGAAGDRQRDRRHPRSDRGRRQRRPALRPARHRALRPGDAGAAEHSGAGARDRPRGPRAGSQELPRGPPHPAVRRPAGAAAEVSAAEPKYVYDFAEGSREMRELLGGKGANIAEMARLGPPISVPAGFTVTTEACIAYLARGEPVPAALEEQVEAALARSRRRPGKRLGDPADPLLVSVRSGARKSMPGMMDTVLNLGLGDEAVEGLAARTGDERFAWDSYRRFVQMFGNVVRGIDCELFERDDPRGEGRARGRARHRAEPGRPARPGRATSRRSSTSETGEDFPQRAARAAARARSAAVFRSWNGARAIEYRRLNGIPDDWGTAVNVQQMVFGNRGERSGSGRRLQPRRDHRRAGALRRLPAQRPGRGRRLRHPRHRRPRRDGADPARGPRRS